MVTKPNLTIIITGASRGIGKAIAECLRNEQTNLALISRHIDDLKKVYKEWNADRTLLIAADVTKEKDVERVISTVTKKFGRVEVLINNAGKFMDKKLEEVSVKEYEEIINTNVKGAFLMSRAVIPQMKKSHKGFIINIGSKISHNTNVAPKKVLYATSKYALEGFSLALNKELKPYGIRVSCLMPGTARTFFSLKSREFLPPKRIGEIVAFLIQMGDVNFESMVFKSKYQDI